MNTRIHHNASESWAIISVALVVLFSVLLDPHVSALLSFMLVIIFAGLKFIQARR